MRSAARSFNSRTLPPVIRIVTPYPAQANNGNWRTAARWARLLRDRYRVIVQAGDEPPGGDRGDVLLALHARRSHAAALEWRTQHPDRPLVVVLTGTDLYRDLPDDARARESAALADRLIVLQDDAVNVLHEPLRAKARVIYQSARRLRSAQKARTRINCIMVGHLRPEKDPATAWRAWTHLPRDAPIFLAVVGGELDPKLAGALGQACEHERRLRWMGEQPHAATRQAIRRAHLLLIPSVMEGGANVVVEAVTAGTPVLASRISGNLGMLGSDYAGYFNVGEPAALALLLLRYRSDVAFRALLARQCGRRRPLFDPARERAALRAVLRELL